MTKFTKNTQQNTTTSTNDLKEKTDLRHRKICPSDAHCMGSGPPFRGAAIPKGRHSETAPF